MTYEAHVVGRVVVVNFDPVEGRYTCVRCGVVYGHAERWSWTCLHDRRHITGRTIRPNQPGHLVTVGPFPTEAMAEAFVGGLR
jgi:hypothetical protein